MALTILEAIELAESYLVCSMYEEAASLASSILKHICHNDEGFEVSGDVHLYDMLESAGMVFVQSLKELGRSSEILNELKLLFMSVTTIPVQVLLTGACFQISEGSPSCVQKSLEEFLSRWSFVDELCYVLVDAEAHLDYMKGSDGRFVLGVDEYLRVVEVYVVTLLRTGVDNMDIAVSWVEKAALPEEERQALLRRLHYLYSCKETNSSQGSSNNLVACSSQKEVHGCNGSSNLMITKSPVDGESDTKQAILKLSRRMDPHFWWFRIIALKLGNARLVISTGKVVLGCLILLIYYVFRRKQATLKRVITRRSLSIKKALVDLWQLAFSYQVNPLAAVQPLPGSRH